MAASNILNEEFFKTFIESDPIEEPPAAVAGDAPAVDFGAATTEGEGVVEDGTAKVVSAEESAISALVSGFGEQQ